MINHFIDKIDGIWGEGSQTLSTGGQCIEVINT